jgi:hypothetical protein
MIATVSLAFPPVQLNCRGWLRVTVAGRPPVTVRGDPNVSELLKLPTLVPPAPFKLYVPATILPLTEPGKVIPSMEPICSE